MKFMGTSFAADEHESTWVFDHASGTAELYTTKRSVWLRAIARNPNFVSASDLMPGYCVTYPMTELRGPESSLKPKDDPTGSVLDGFLTDSERTSRAKVAQNFGKHLGKPPASPKPPTK
jgi:hypothetical protein